MSPIRREHQQPREQGEVVRGIEEKAIHLKRVPAKEMPAASTALTVPQFNEVCGNGCFTRNDAVISRVYHMMLFPTLQISNITFLQLRRQGERGSHIRGEMEHSYFHSGLIKPSFSPLQ